MRTRYFTRPVFLLECLSELSNESNQPITSYALLRRDCCKVVIDFDLVAWASTGKEITLRVIKKNLEENKNIREKI